MRFKEAPSLDRLKEVLDYDPETGIFRWKVTLSYRNVAGNPAGSLADGYICVQFDKCRFRAHRLAWFYMTGQWPPYDVDHINLDRSDNRFANLRLATRSQNKSNVNAPSTNSSGIKGVSWHKLRGCWRAVIKINGRYKHLGSFKTKEEAHEAYKRAAFEAFGEFARAA